MTAKLILNLQSAPPVAETIADWAAQTYVLGATARGVAQTPQQVQLAPDDVLEIELENGTRLLVAGEDAERYLGRVAGRGADAAGAITVGATLRLSGAHLPPSTSRDGVGAWALKSLRVFRQGPAGIATMAALTAAGSAQDWVLEQRRGLYRLQTDQWKLSPLDKMPYSAEPVLLFLHGTISSTAGSFRGLWGEQAEVDARAQLAQLYGDRVYGFEHRSLTDSPIANVLALVETLPAGARLHVVSHSRGGMLGELLARANRIDDDPFTEADIQRFLAHGERTGRTGYLADADALRALNTALKQRAIRVERFVRVAATARGTTLASGRLDRWASVMLNLPGQGLALVPGMEAAAEGCQLVTRFLLAVVKARTDARVLPGLEAMMPDSPLVALLNAPDVRVAYPLHVIAGDFVGEFTKDRLLAWLGDCLSEAFYGGQTDLVVNTPSMSGGAARKQGIWLKSVAGPAVHHLSYFKRAESVRPLLAALGGSNDGFVELDGPSTAYIGRGGVDVKPRPDGPIVLMLPGIMGTQLAVGRRIWLCPLSMIPGGMDALQVDARDVTTDGWIDKYFERFARHLAASHEVRPFVYDWRLSIEDAAVKFGKVLDDAMDEAEQRKQPLRIVAHSMGGLVARLALSGRWERFKAIDGSRLLQFGTPNQGSHSIAAVLTGRDGLVQMIERWLDWKHDMREFIDIVRRFPGVLELLPWPGDDGKAADGVDYFDPAVWQAWCKGDAENRSAVVFEPAKGAGDGWQAPLTDALLAAKAVVEKIRAAPLEASHTLYVAGSERTPVALRLAADGQLEIGWTERGDGRVPWATGIPAGVKTWFVDAAHGDLLKHEDAFGEYVQLLESGDCSLGTQRGGSAVADVVYTPAALASHTLYPSEDEVLAAVMGGRPPAARRSDGGAESTADTVARVEIYHGSLAAATTPVLIGAYANDSLRGSARFLDRHLAGSLRQAQVLGCYPAQPGQFMVFRRMGDGGAIVVGLGAVGALQPGELVRTLTQGLVEFARVSAQALPADGTERKALDVSALLVGAGYAGLSIAVATRCLFEAVLRSNRLCADAGLAVRIGLLQVYEDEESRVIAAANAARELSGDSRFASALSFDGRIRSAKGGYSARAADASGADGWRRLHITGLPDQGLRFTMVADRARNEVDDEASQRQAVDGLIRSATATTTDQPGISRALYELMLPNGLKEVLADHSGLILAVDSAAAIYPWEMMRDTPDRGEAPFATRIGLVRQLASPHGRSRVATVADWRALVVGDTDSGLAKLPGAQREAAAVARLLREQAYAVALLERPCGQQVFVSLFDERYRIVHLAAHGVVAVDGKGSTGMVLGPETYLTTAQIAKMRHVPEFVFLNCCHLGNMADDAQPRWSELAANLATQFIEMGCKAVVAAGWAVDDGAAECFAATFYARMLAGEKFGDAVLAARQEAYRCHPSSNTWGAYQAYGDEIYRLKADEVDDWQAPDYVHASQIVGDLDRIRARIGALVSLSTPGEKALYGGRLEKIEVAVRARFSRHAEVRAALASAWADWGDADRAIEHYRAALDAEDAAVSLQALELLANLEVRHGEALAQQAASKAEGEALMATGLARLHALVGIGKTVVRLSLIGSYWKRRTLLPGAGQVAIDEALREMEKAYVVASNFSFERDGDRDYYPTLNVLEGRIVLAARGDAAAGKAVRSEHAARLADALANGRRRYASDRSFFHAHSAVEAMRVDALRAMLDAAGSGGLDDEKVRQAIVAAHREIVARQGNALERDSMQKHLQWLIALLPAKGKHKGLRAAVVLLQSEMERA